MKKDQSLGAELILAVSDALARKESGKTVRHKINIAQMRKGLGMTQVEFSAAYHIKLETLRNWEQEKRMPDTAVLAYLTCIAKQPKLISNMLNKGD